MTDRLTRLWKRYGITRRCRYEWQKARAEALSRELAQYEEQPNE